MDEEILFTITKSSLETGLRGFPVGYCTTSTVDPLKGLFYAGYAIPEVINWSEEEVIFLLQNGRKGTLEEVEKFSKEIKKRSNLSKELKSAIDNLPRNVDPMKLFSIAILLCSSFESSKDYREDALNVIAKVPEIAARVINHHAGWQGEVVSNPNLGYMENFAQMLKIPTKVDKHFGEVLKQFNILHFDHGGGNLSTFVGKCVASGLEDMYGSLSSALCALAGPRHGKANQECLEFTEKVLKAVGENAKAEDVEKYIRDTLARGDLVFGFGHAVLRVEDPRATVFYKMAEEFYGSHPLVKMGLLIRTAGTKVLKENPKIASPYPNVDAMSGVVLTAAGFNYPQYYTLLFGLARVTGIAIQIVYERCIAREGKGTPIVRPKYLYKKPS